MIKVDNKEIKLEHFGDGTLKCSVPDINSAAKYANIMWCYDSDEELFQLWSIVQHIRQKFPYKEIYLDMPYIPHARQDRNVSNRLFTLKYFSQLINLMNFSKVSVLDPHSDVSTALIDRVDITNIDLFTWIDKLEICKGVQNYQIMYPDNGAAKKYCATENDVVGYKHRDNEGNIESYSFNGLKDSTELVIIRDDICSYGGTFVAAAKALKERGVKSIVLIVSHCENNIIKGKVFDYIDKVFTTDSICTAEHPNLHVIEIYRN